MEIATESEHRTLAFVAACNTDGYRPTTTEVARWLVKHSPLEAAMASAISRHSAASAESLSMALMGRPASTVDRLVELEWLSKDGARLLITDLGRALLRYAEAPENDDSVVEVLLHSNDALAYPKLIGELTKVGDGLLVDPYLGIEQLHSCVTHTKLTRFLIREKEDSATTAEIATYLETVAPAIEVRRSKALHDRLAIPADREVAVLSFGTSLNGVGRRTTTVVTRPSQATADFLRQQYEDVWEAAHPAVK